MYKKIALIISVLLLGFSCQPKKKEPKLIVFVSVDQMRSDYVKKFSHFFGPDGFNRLYKEGHWFENCFFEHSCTQTGPGHAALGSAAYAYQTGVFSNVFFNRMSQRWQYCVEDTSVHLIGKKVEKTNKKGVSPIILKTIGIGDLIKQNFPKAKVFGISLKDRAAILMSGKKSDGAFWYNSKTGRFISSSYYFETLPKWLRKFNKNFMKPFLKKYKMRYWKRKISEAEYEQTQGKDFRSGEADVKYMGKIFPHRIFPDSAKGFSTLKYTPYGDSVLFELFKTIVKKEKLGADHIPDLLCVSFSATDYIGHTYGPGSHEMMDQVIRLDIIVGKMMKFLDKTIGKNKYLLALSADHGVLPIPEELQKTGVDAGRVVDSLTEKFIENSINKVVGKSFPRHHWIFPYGGDFVYFKPSFLKLNKELQNKAIIKIKKDVGKLKGIEAILSREDILNNSGANKVMKRIRYGYFEAGAGDLYVLLKPNYLHSKTSVGYGTSHGSPYDYDAHVPLFLFGTGVPAGITRDTVGPADIGGTIASMLNLKFENHQDAENIISK